MCTGGLETRQEVFSACERNQNRYALQAEWKRDEKIKAKSNNNKVWRWFLDISNDFTVCIHVFGQFYLLQVVIFVSWRVIKFTCTLLLFLEWILISRKRDTAHFYIIWGVNDINKEQNKIKKKIARLMFSLHLRVQNIMLCAYFILCLFVRLKIFLLAVSLTSKTLLRGNICRRVSVFQQGSNQDKYQKVLLTIITRLLWLCLWRS